MKRLCRTPEERHEAARLSRERYNARTRDERLSENRHSDSQRARWKLVKGTPKRLRDPWWSLTAESRVKLSCRCGLCPACLRGAR